MIMREGLFQRFYINFYMNLYQFISIYIWIWNRDSYLSENSNDSRMPTFYSSEGGIKDKTDY